MTRRRYVFTNHVVDRLNQRSITRTQVEHVLDHPTRVEPTPQGSKRYTGTFPTGRELRVWVVDPPESDGGLIVKTAAWKD